MYVHADWTPKLPTKNIAQVWHKETKNGTNTRENLKKEKKTITIKYTSKIIAKSERIKKLYTITIIITNTLKAMKWIFEGLFN